ncbi:MAG: phosphoribosylamine--glycine ligase [Phycisphaerales bacterium]|nr:MAG: phosphoribosylamine--glycine ligase [Phycisphaerales bacterium]
MTRTNVLLIGGGGREHAIASRLVRSPALGTLFVTHPENPGLAALGQPVSVPVNAREIYRLQQFCDRHNVGLVVIGPEDPLAEGFADALRTDTRLIFGPNKDGARLEADKAWCKQLLRGASVPQADGRAFTDAEQAKRYLETRVIEDETLVEFFEKAARYPDPADRRKWIDRELGRSPEIQAAYAAARSDLPVIKATGLARGKGVVVPATLGEAITAIERIMTRREFGDAGRTVVIEERLTGAEVSVLAITDGRTIATLPVCQDHKRLREGGQGPNTGGMGAFTPSTLLDDTQLESIEREIIVPTVDALRREGIDYRGVLYAGLMLTPAGPKVLEFNCRFGDPECQPLMARFEGDLLELFKKTASRKLDEAEFGFSAEASCCVVLAAEGYPEKPRSGDAISGLEQAGALPGVEVFHAGTKVVNGEVVTAGGRVLGVTGTGATIEDARERAYAGVAKISFRGMQHRKDIGAEAVAVKTRG